jgi:hypothetical protein
MAHCEAPGRAIMGSGAGGSHYHTPQGEIVAPTPRGMTISTVRKEGNDGY